MEKLKNKNNVDIKIFAENLEDDCLEQIENIINKEESKNCKIRIMPDAHAAKDICVGFTSTIDDKVNPSFVGVDIGCGLYSANLDKEFNSILETKGLKYINDSIKKAVPKGSALRQKPFDFSNLDTTDFTKNMINFFENYSKKFNTYKEAKELSFFEEVEKLCKKIDCDYFKALISIGTLGGGNHFIEIGKDSGLDKYSLTVHSGSRVFGAKVFEYHHKKALLNVNHIGYLENEDLYEYLFDMMIAQYYALLNRETIIRAIEKELKIAHSDDVISTVHNYINPNDFIIRKGAIANYDNKCIIPLNMKDGVLIVQGKSNEDWNYSAPHGAGRILSRKDAKKSIKLEDYQNIMQGVYSDSINRRTLDESPFVYKNSDMIKRLIEPTANIIYTLKPILNVKG